VRNVAFVGLAAAVVVAPIAIDVIAGGLALLAVVDGEAGNAQQHAVAGACADAAGRLSGLVVVVGLTVAVIINAVAVGVAGRSARQAGIDQATADAAYLPGPLARPNPALRSVNYETIIHLSVAVVIHAVAVFVIAFGCPGHAGVAGYARHASGDSVAGARAGPTLRGVHRNLLVGQAIAVVIQPVAQLD
jgi:hypothetical protein